MVGLLAAGCCDKHKCAVPVAEIVVRDQSGSLPPGTRVQRGEITESALSCSRGEAGACGFRVTGSGGVTVSAPGYKAASVSIDRKEDDCGNGLSQQIEVVLVPEASAGPSSITMGSALGCG